MHDQYPVTNGRIRTHVLEITIVEHCNLSCRDCNHLSPIIPPTLAVPELLLADLRVFARVYYAKCVRLLGGEPLLHPKVVKILQDVRTSGVADLLGMETNGLLLGRMPETFWEAIDLVVVSAYPGREPREELLTHCRRLAEKHQVDFTVTLFPVFRKTYAELGTSDHALVRRIYETCAMVHTWRCHSLANGYFYKCPLAYYLPRALGPDGDNLATTDGIAIDTSPDLHKRLLTYLQSSDPLVSCRRCLGTVGITQPWEEVPRRNWKSVHCHQVEKVLDHSLLCDTERRLVATNVS